LPGMYMGTGAATPPGATGPPMYCTVRAGPIASGTCICEPAYTGTMYGICIGKYAVICGAAGLIGCIPSAVASCCGTFAIGCAACTTLRRELAAFGSTPEPMGLATSWLLEAR